MLGVSGLACVVYAAADSIEIDGAVFALVAGTTITSIVVDLRVHRPAAVLPWRLVLAASVLFLLGGLSRALARDRPEGTLALSAVLGTVGGYLAVGGAATLWLRARASGTGATTALDAVLMGIAAALVVWVVFALPASKADEFGLLVNSSYPIIDAVLLTVLVQLLFTSAPGDRSLPC